ncbi:hypothetical protein AB205_0198670, partial [Aquarana catesbeiana]
MSVYTWPPYQILIISFYSITPIFAISSVTGESLDLLKVFLNILPPLTNSREQEELMQQLPEFQVDEIYTVPEVGTVVGGTLYSGVCKEGEHLVVGPTDSGSFLPLKVCSIQRNRSACRVLRAGQAATLALGAFDRSLLRKDELRTGEKAVVRFRFIKHPEYLKPGTKLLFREGVTKGIGHVCSLQ